MIKPISRIKEEESSSSGISINIAKLVGQKSEAYNPNDGIPVDVSEKPKRRSGSTNMTKPKKDDSNPYYDKYKETNALLNQTIYEIDELNSGLKNELRAVMTSKTLKKKYDYMSVLAGTSSNLLSTKITAIRELNKSITDSTSLEIRMAKEMKQDEESDDKKIMDMYNAFINTPIGSYSGPIAPTNVDLMLGGNGTTILPTIDGQVQSDDIGYNQYINSLTPEQKRIHMEGKNVQTVVVFDPETGHRYFDNMDMDTGQSVPGLPVPEPQFLDNLNINQKTGVASDSNLNLKYTLVVKRSAPSFENY